MQDNAVDPHPIITIEIGTITVIIGTDIGLAGRDPIPVVLATGVTVKASHEGVILDPITNPHTTAHQAKETQVHTATNETLHTGDPHHTEVSQRDCSRSRPCTSHKHTHKTSSKPSYSSNCTAWKNKDRKYKQVTIDDSPSEYYSSDEQASNSDEDLN